MNPVSDHGVGWAKSVMGKLTLQTYSGISILDSGLVRWGFFFPILTLKLYKHPTVLYPRSLHWLYSETKGQSD